MKPGFFTTGHSLQDSRPAEYDGAIAPPSDDCRRLPVLSRINQRSWRNRWDRFEAGAGLVAAFFLAFGPLTCATLALIFSLCLGERNSAAIAVCVIAPTLPMAIWLARMASRTMDRFRVEQAELTANDSKDGWRGVSFAMLLADSLPRLPWIVRIPLFVWWIAHFAAGVLLVEYSEFLTEGGWLFPELTQGFTGLLYAWLFHFAANIFLVLSLTALLQSRQTIECIWRRRFVIDAMMVCALLA